MKTKIRNSLYNALILGGKMQYELYEFELQEHINYWKDGLKQDGEDFVFILTVNNCAVAMLLITNNDLLYINEKAREQLKKIWKKAYETNIETLLPNMATELSNDIFSVNGVKIANTV